MMHKIYRYRNLSFKVPDETEVLLMVEFISDGNLGHTAINVPGSGDSEIENSGSVNIGIGSNLRGDKTTVSTEVANLIPQEDEIRVAYRLNGQLIKEHVNLKSEADKVKIILYIKFPEP
ncbi:MAG: hypothetical protein COW63_10160 [Bacteroidetes bacterium CG18_big_fil_WC_8_21_14_2_50_41_14]|nr:MAG: hypothetical protein COW63_10160 [Bacteroidetes bacterium CG18_big_fil_WC_8_21_14_2_50_41_14]PJB59552.1 MAG: hypothetical protein CO098_02825 [Bacteroidetes bacterium CG_4_9_14_3_um_filter_41_19]